MLPPPLGSFKDHAKPLVSFIWIESSIKTFETVTLTNILQIWKGVFIATQSFPPQGLAPHRAKVILLKSEPDHTTSLFQTTRCLHLGVLRRITRRYAISAHPHLIFITLLLASLLVLEHSQVCLYLGALGTC